MAARPFILALAAGVGLILAGCVSAGPFPSLAPRPEEADFSTAESVRPAPDVPDDARLRARIGALVAQALEGLTAFDAAFPAADRATAAAGAEGSDGWTVAQQALSRLEAARRPSTTARADLDALAVDRAAMPTSAGDLATLDRAIAEAERIVLNQQVRFDRLRARLRPAE